MSNALVTILELELVAGEVGRALGAGHLSQRRVVRLEMSPRTSVAGQGGAGVVVVGAQVEP